MCKLTRVSGSNSFECFVNGHYLALKQVCNQGSILMFMFFILLGCISCISLSFSSNVHLLLV